MKKLILTIVLCTVLFTGSGCINSIKSGLFGTKAPVGSEGSYEEEKGIKSQTTADISGTIEFEPIPEGSVQSKPVEVKAAGKTITVPSHAKGKIEIGVKDKTNTYNFGEIVTSWKKHSGTMVLTVMGGLMLLGAVVLCYFGMWKLGGAVGIAGVLLITCAVLIDSFPWIFLIVAILLLIIAGYIIYAFVKRSHIEDKHDDVFGTVEAIGHAINKLPKEIQEEVKHELRTHDNSATIREITRKALGKK